MMQPLSNSALEHFERVSGVYSRAPRRSELPASPAVTIAERVLAVTGTEPVGVLLHEAPSFAACARILPVPFASEEYPLRDLGNWLRGVEGMPRVLTVPARLKMWVSVRTLIGVPIASPVWKIGAIFVSSEKITRATVRDLEVLASDIALEIEEETRSNTLTDLRRMAASY